MKVSKHENQVIHLRSTSQNPKIANNTNMLNFEGSLQLLKIGLYTQGQDRWKLHAKTIHSLMGKSGSYKAAAKSGTSGPKTCILTLCNRLLRTLTLLL